MEESTIEKLYLGEDPMNYKKYWSTSCASCGNAIKTDVVSYGVRGNYCISCSSKVENICKLRVALKSPQKNKERIKKLLDRLSKWGIGTKYILEGQRQIDDIKESLRVAELKSERSAK